MFIIRLTQINELVVVIFTEKHGNNQKVSRQTKNKGGWMRFRERKS